MRGESGVRCVEPDLGERLVHAWQDGDYALEDIPDLFRLGRVVSELGQPVRVALTADEIRELKVMADAYSFDFEEGLIGLCLDLHRFAIERFEDRFVFVEVG